MKKKTVHIIRFLKYKFSNKFWPSASFIAIILYLMINIPVEHSQRKKKITKNSGEKKVFAF